MKCKEKICLLSLGCWTFRKWNYKCPFNRCLMGVFTLSYGNENKKSEELQQEEYNPLAILDVNERNGKS